MSHSITDAGYLPLAMPPKAKTPKTTKAAAKDAEAEATSADAASDDATDNDADNDARDKKRDLTKRARERARGIAKRARAKARETARAARSDARAERKARRKGSTDEVAPSDEDVAGETIATYSIDELSAHTGVPSRTIRFYQAQHILPKPERRGRVAVYTDDHVARLKVIAKLQDRGLRLRGMKQLLARKDSDTAVNEWLGLSEKLSTPWTAERARAADEAEMTALVGDRPDGTLAALLRVGLVTRPEEAPHTYFIPSPGLLDVALSLVDAGLTMDMLAELEPVLRDGLRDTADSVVDYFVQHHGLGDPGDAEQISKSLDALRTLGANAINIIFAQEIERTFTRLLEQGDPTKVRSGRRRRGGNRRS